MVKLPASEAFRLDPTFLERYRTLPVAFGFGVLGELTYLRTYSRLKPDGTNEAWWETVRRVVEGTYSMQKRWILANHLPWSETKAQRSAKEMYDRMFHMKFLPPGRGLWAMGSALTEERELWASLNNCAMVSTADLAEDKSDPFTFLMDASMLGIGVGFDTKGAGKLVIQAPTDEVGTHVIADTREGWVGSVRLLLTAFFTGLFPDPIFDYSKIRLAGEPIKGFGGVAAGPEPLRQLHDDIRNVLRPLIGQPITVTAIVDIMNLIGTCVVAGNVRRTAEVAFGDPFSEEFLDLKNYEKNPQRETYGWTSNNSIFAELGMDYTEAAKRVALNGEPGFAWLDNMREYSRMNGIVDNVDRRVVGSNPCITADSLVMTAGGPRFVTDLLGRSFLADVGDGVNESKVGFFFTGHRPVYRLSTREGHELKVTADHKILTTRLTTKTQYNTWKEAKDLLPGDLIVLGNFRESYWDGPGTYGDGWLLGSLVGDGHFHSNGAKLQYWGENKDTLLSIALGHIEKLGGDARYHKNRTGTLVEERDLVSTGSVKLSELAEEFGISENKNIDRHKILSTSFEFQRGFLRGFFDADGSVQGSQNKGVSVRLGTVRLDHLKLVQEMLIHMGINSTIYQNRSEAETRLLPDGRGGHSEYPTQASHELIISGDNLQEFQADVGFEDPTKSERLFATLKSYKRKLNRERFVARFESLTLLGTDDVFDCTVEEMHRFSANGIVVHNCLEQSLESYELCCLVETFPAKHDTLEDYLRTLKFAYLYAKTVTLGRTPWPRTNEVLLRNRRIGLSQSGIVQAIEKFGIDEYRHWCEEGYETVQYYDETYSNWLAIPRSIKTTSVKPSGTVSLLAGATPGMHFPENQFYIRRIRLSTFSELVAPLQAAGYVVEPCFGDDSSVVVEVPVAVEGVTRTVKDVSLWEQLSLTAFLQKHWADNQVSCTVTFDPATESNQIAPALNYFQYQLKGISFLPRLEAGAYRQMPYEAITEAEYHAQVAKLLPLQLSSLHEDSQAERFCDGASCIL